MHTTNAATGGVVGMISHEYSSMSPFNIDNTRLLLGHSSYFALYDGDGNFLKNLWPNPGLVGSSEPRWSKSDPNVLYYIAGNKLMKYNVGTNAGATVHTFSEYSSISGKGESDISDDGDHFVFAGDSRYVFVYEISTDKKGPVLDAGSGKFDDIYITPKNNVIVGYYATGTARFMGMEMYDRNMVFLRQATHAIGHQDVSTDTNGDEVLIWANGADPAPVVSCNAGIVKVRLSDGKQTCVWTEGSWTNAYHISAPDNSGWFFLETYNPSDVIPPNGWVAQNDEVLQVKMDGSEVRRLLHHRSRPLNSYTYQPKASVSHDGTKLVFTSNFGLQAQIGNPTEYSDEYLVDLTTVSPGTGGTSGGSSGSSSGGSSDSGGGTTPPTTPPPTTPPPATTPPPTVAPPTATVARVEQNGAGVTYTGQWITNGGSANSGGSAVLAGAAGSKANLAFNGTGVSWIAYRDEWSGIANVYVDGVLKAAVDTYSSPGKAQAVAYTVSGLASGSHTLTIEVTGTRNPSSAGAWVWVDAFDVTSGGSASTALPGTCSTTVQHVEQDALSIQYSGTWYTYANAGSSGGSSLLAAGPGARATFGFTGCSVKWIAEKDSWSGIANVYVDGTLRATVDTYSATTAPQSAAYSVTGLSYGTHTISIEVVGKRSDASSAAWIWVDAFDYQ
jgi:hypothetical protein